MIDIGTKHSRYIMATFLQSTHERQPIQRDVSNTWRRHPTETFPALLALCEGDSPVTSGYPSQMPVALSVDVFFDLLLNKRLSKQSRRWWFGLQRTVIYREWIMLIAVWYRLRDGTIKWFFNPNVTTLLGVIVLVSFGHQFDILSLTLSFENETIHMVFISWLITF